MENTTYCMSLYEFCQVMADNLHFGHCTVRIFDNASNQLIFTGTFSEFLSRTDWTLGFVNSTVLGISMMLNIKDGRGEYITMVMV